MELDFTQNRYLKVLSNRNLLGKILVGSFLLNVMQMIHLMTREDKIILVPPTLSQDVWVMGGQSSKSYIEEWALYLSSELLNMTPETVAFHYDAVLRYVHPETSATLKKQFEADSKHLKENTISTLFKPKTVTVTQAGSQGSALVEGTLSTFVGSKLIESDDKKYTLTFETSKYAPQLSLTSFKETPDPLSPPGNDGDVPLKNSS